MKIGDKWGEWTVDSLLGEGTFGKVFRIVRNEFGHTYESALKVIRVPQSEAELNSIRNEGMEEDSVTTYFRSMVDEIVGEFTMMSELRGHSNIVSYEDHSVTPLTDSFGWEICIRMELLTPLYKYLKGHTLTIRDIITLGIDMCKALEVCQKFNLIHRDIKPENIFVSNMDTFKLGDFGIARQMEKTISGMSKKGTYSYMAPEVYKGQPYNSTVDIYSLGIVLYRFLNNNRTPFLPPYPQSIKYNDRELANIRRMSGDPIPPPSNAQGRLAEIVLKACSYDPKDRYERPEEMRRALESILYSEYEAGIIYPSGDELHTMDGTNTSGSSYFVEEATDDYTLPIDATSGISRGPSVGTMSGAAAAIEPLTEDIDDLEEETLDDPDLLPSRPEPTESERIAEEAPDEDKAGQTDQAEAIEEPVKKEQKESGDRPVTGKKDGKKKPRTSIIAIAGAAIVALGIFGFVYFNNTVPDVSGLDADGAKAMIEYAHLTYDEDRQFSEDVPRGEVISQTASPGSHLRRGAPVEVIISKGKPIPAPNLVGVNIKDAQKSAKKLGLVVEVASEEYSDTLKKDLIISQDIEPDFECEAEQVITVVKSKGITQVKVPDVIGKTADKASEALKKEGFKSEIVEVYSSSDVGTIVDQSVAGGKTADKGSTITISKSVGPEPVRSSSSGKKKSKKKKKSGGGGSTSWGDGDW